LIFYSFIGGQSKEEAKEEARKEKGFTAILSTSQIDPGMI